MRKIIGFKLVLRIHETKRRAKKAKLDLAAAGFDDLPLQKLLDEATAAVSPRVLFETFKHPDPDQPMLSPIPGLAYSLVLASLGEGLTALAPLDSNEGRRCLLRLVEEMALEETIRFATTLLEDEALKDVCELSPITPLSGEALPVVLRKLEGVKIGVSLGESGALVPSASSAVSLSWLSKSKAKGKK